MKNLLSLGLFTIVMVPMILFPVTVHGNNNGEKTLQQLYNELTQMEKELKENKNTQALTESQIKEITNNMIRINERKVEIEKNIITLNKEINELNDEISFKDEEIKKLMTQLQKIKSNNVYLEYTFGAATMKEFIYRVSIIEQLTKHNNELIDTMNTSITNKNKKTEELAKEQKRNEEQKIEFGKEQEKLKGSLTGLVEYQISLEDEIKEAKKAIDTYKSLGCKLNETLLQCLKNSNTGFLRPVVQGRVTSPYGWRVNPLGSYPASTFHSGIDVGGNAVGTPVYASAEGLVVGTGRFSCGGNYVVIQHQINGVAYATRYLHLNTIRVVMGQYVTKDTIVGGLGGGESYDQCSTGPHAHFDMLKGVYGSKQGNVIVGFKEPFSINPGATNLITFPKVGGWFYDRYTKF